MRDTALVSHLPYYQHAASALSRAGWLDAFITAPIAEHALAGRWLPLVGGEIGRFNESRVAPALAGVPLRRMWAAQAVALGAQRISMATGRGTALGFRARVWDLAVRLHLGDPAVVHAVSELYGSAVRRAHRRGAVAICDVRSAHPAEQVALVAPMLARHNVGYTLPERHLRPRLDRAFADADLLVCNSAFTAATFVARGVDPAKLATVPLGCDVERFAPAPQPPRRFTVLFVGRERHAKGVLELAEASRALQPGSRVLLSGDPDPVTVSAFRSSKAQVRFLGPVHTADLPEVYREASVLVLPSYAEGFGMVALEAMASGLPVIVSDRVGAAHLVSDAVGHVVPAGDADALAERLVGLERDADLAGRLGRSARVVAEANTWAAYGERLVSVYRTRVEPLLR